MPVPRLRGSWFASLLILALLVTPGRLRAEAPPAAARGFDAYVETVEARLARQHASARGVVAPEDEARLRDGGLVLENLTPRDSGGWPGALLHHWRATAFVAGASASEMERTLRNFAEYPRIYAPEVLAASVVEDDGDHYRIRMRVQQRHGITVTLDTMYAVAFGRLDAGHGWSTSRSTEIREVDRQDHGFLWRQNTYWSWEARDGGLLLQVESVSLTRSIPPGLGWLIGPYLESIPRESLTFTLRATCAALQAEAQAAFGHPQSALKRRTP